MAWHYSLLFLMVVQKDREEMTRKYVQIFEIIYSGFQ